MSTCSTPVSPLKRSARRLHQYLDEIRSIDHNSEPTVPALTVRIAHKVETHQFTNGTRISHLANAAARFPANSHRKLLRAIYKSVREPVTPGRARLPPSVKCEMHLAAHTHDHCHAKHLMLERVLTLQTGYVAAPPRTILFTARLNRWVLRKSPPQSH